MKGRIIVLEGIDGAGGETQSKLLLDYLENKNIPSVRLTYPDYETPIGKTIHEFLHKKHDFGVEVQVLLHAADRVKDKEKIIQFLNEGKTVICDRYFTSILAYQCGQGFPLDKALNLADILGIPKPDTIIYLKITPETSIKRKLGEKNDLDRNESNKELQERISKQYETLIESNVFGKWVVINGERTREEVLQEIIKLLGF